jgi:PAS domain S-box-containing protein
MNVNDDCSNRASDVDLKSDIGQAHSAGSASVTVRDVALSPEDSAQRRREKLARVVLDEMYQFVALLDIEGSLLEVNRAALEGGGIRLEDISGKPFWTARWWTLSRDTQERLKKAVAQAAQGEFIRYDVEVYGSAHGSETIIIDFSLVPVRDIEGRVVFLLAEGRNITEKKKAEAEIARKNEELQLLLDRVRELDELKSQFFANISHELRTPLALILGPAEKILAESDHLSDLERRDIEVIRRNAVTLLKLVNDLLDLAKLDAGKAEISYANADAVQIARVVGSHFEALAAQRGVAFAVEAPASIPAQVDPEKLERVLLNLLSNAFKFTPEGGRVKLALECDDGLLISVQDSGPGVPAAERRAIFERFRQAEGGATRRFGGTGLGLAITKDFIHLHGGSIAVTDAPGGGALFTVHMPLTAPEGVPVRTAVDMEIIEKDPSLAGTLEELTPLRLIRARRDVQPDRPTVLVAEDNPELNRFIAECLGGEYNVATAADGQEALDKALQTPPDLLVMDIMMPRLSGDQLVAQLRCHPHLNSVPILVLSAKADDALRVRLLREGAQDYVVKPFSAEELLARAGNLVKLKLAREVLQAEVESQQQDIAQLARDVAARNRARDAALSEAKLARDEARAASEAKSHFLGLISHELRTPLQSIQLQAGFMRRQALKAGDDQYQPLLQQLVAAGERMTDMVDNLLEAVRAEAGRIPVERVELDVDSLLTEIVVEMDHRAQQRPLTLVYEGTPLRVYSDPALLRMIAINLIDNAIKYAAEGTVVVKLKAEADLLLLSVSDTGPGIAPEHQQRIFEPFEQLSDIRHKHVPGVGLGLALVKRVVTTLGGTLSLDSEVGRGSTFTVSLPLRVPSLATGSHD